MTNITERLRRIYVAEGTNYVQEAADLIDNLRAENKAIRELMNCYNLGGWTDSLALIKERDALRAERDQLVNDVHSCGPTCTRAGCVNRRLREALREYVAAADNSVRSSDHLEAMLRFGEADKAARAALGEAK